jgi:hypothetical protein
MLPDHINRYVSSADAHAAFNTDALGVTLLDSGIKKGGSKYAFLHCAKPALAAAAERQ